MGSLWVYLFFVVLIAVVYKVLAHLRTKKANLSSGCVACDSNNLDRSQPGKVICRDCGYEGSADGGGALSEDDVQNFTN